MTVFKKILDREVPADIVYEDDMLCAFRDINPQAPTHILIIPKKEIASLSNMKSEDIELMGAILFRAKLIAAEEGLSDYRVVTNNGPGAGQSVFHLHFHILGGRPLSWPPG